MSAFLPSEAEGKKPLRLMLWHWGRRGGGPRYTLELARALKDRSGVELHLSISRQCEIAEDFRALQLPIFEIDTYDGAADSLWRSVQLPFLWRSFRRYLVTNGIEVVDSTMAHLWTGPFALLMRRTGIRIILTIHDATRHPGEDGILRRLAFHPAFPADAYIALSDFVAQELFKHYQIQPESISVVPLGALRHGAAPGNATAWEEVREPGPPRILFFGRILPYKGLDLLLEAYANLRAAGTNIRLKIAGYGDLQPYARLLHACPDVEIDNRWISDSEVPAILTKADMLAVPYTEASQSGVIAAAFAVGLPVVATPVGGLSEQVRHGENGLLADAVSAPALERALRRMILEDDLLERLGRGAAATGAGDMSWCRIANMVEALARKTGRV
jgi:glycosyltransferase involved in cell wall biosynthesis